MLIHTNKLSRIDFDNAAIAAGVKIERFIEKGSKSRERKYDVLISGDGKQGGQFGSQDFKSATWDQWGIFLNELYDADDNIIAGQYKTREHFNFLTDDRFEWLDYSQAHVQHRWTHMITVTGSYSEFECAKCGAVQRNLFNEKSMPSLFV